jgi:hypothetical protein
VGEAVIWAILIVVMSGTANSQRLEVREVHGYDDFKDCSAAAKQLAGTNQDGRTGSSLIVLARCFQTPERRTVNDRR